MGTELAWNPLCWVSKDLQPGICGSFTYLSLWVVTHFCFLFGDWFLICFTCHFLPILIHSILSLLLLSWRLKGANVLWKGVLCQEDAVWSWCFYSVWLLLIWYSNAVNERAVKDELIIAHLVVLIIQIGLSLISCHWTTWKKVFWGKKHYLYIFIYDAI